MIDISVKDLVKSFDADTNILDGITFDVQSGERVGLLGKNGAGKTTLFRILTGEIDYNSGEVRFAPGKKVGLISQIPHYPAGYTVDDVLHTAFAGLEKIKKQMRALEAEMAEHAGAEMDGEARTADDHIGKMDLYTLGLSGGAGSAAKRQALLQDLGLPGYLSANALVDALNLRMTREELYARYGETQ